MQRKNLIIISALLCLLLSGCTAAEQAEKAENSSGKAPASGVNLTNDLSNSRDSENVRFLYEKPQSEQHAAGIYNCKTAEISLDKYTALFSKDPECEKRSYPETKRRINRYKTGSENGTIDYTNNILQGVNYYTEQGMNYIAVEDGNEVIDTVSEFDFISRADLSKKIKSVVRGLFGVDVEVTVNAVTADRFASDASKHLQAVEDLYGSAPDIDKYGTPTDFYIVSFVQMIDGVPFDGGNGDAVYTADGLEFLSIHAPVKVGSKIDPGKEFIDLDGAEKLLKEKYGLLLLDEPELIERAELTYAHSDGVMTPVWKFTAQGSVETTFDAYTGKEIVWAFTGEKA